MEDSPTRKPTSHLKIVSWVGSLVVSGLFLLRVVASELPAFLFPRYQNLLSEHTPLVLFLPGIFCLSAFVLYTFRSEASVSDNKRSVLRCYTDHAEAIPVICLLLVLLAMALAIFQSLLVEQVIQSLH